MEFQAWPKTSRLYRDVVITEKIDGTNAAVVIEEHHFGEHLRLFDDGFGNVVQVALGPVNPELETPDFEYWVGAQSRNRMITPGSDNAGFARWVQANAQTLTNDLGPGTHFGEWWGQGIQRKYGLDHKVFSLFNTAKWGNTLFSTPNLNVVPVIFQGPFSDVVVRSAAERLSVYGSLAAPGFKDPEGVCVFHTHSRKVFKYTLDGDGHKEA